MRIRKTVGHYHFDAVLINGSDMLWAVNELPSEMPTVLIAHNLEHQLLVQKLANYPFLSPLLQREITNQRRYEIEGFSRAGGVIFVSAPEMAWGCSKVPDCEPFMCRRFLRTLRHVVPLSPETSSVSDSSRISPGCPSARTGGD